jgi:hypothetical protein
MTGDSRFDWIVEHEILPPDEPRPPDSPPPRHRILPRWVYPLVLLLSVGFGFLIYLWLRGGAAEPMPNPEGPVSRLQSIIQLEVDALRNGDQELYLQVQGRITRRRHVEPPPDRWFSTDGSPGPVELVEIRMLTADTAQAVVRLTWLGADYRLIWFYRREGDRWSHTDWEVTDLGERRQLNSDHIQMTYYQAERIEAEEITRQLESLVDRLCQIIECPGNSPQVRLQFDRYSPYYHASVDGVLDYRLPSPSRIRWPWDGKPEPIVLGSVARHLVQDMIARPALNQSAENEAALILTASWLAHHLEGLETLPCTHWLDDVAARDGTEPIAEFVTLMQRGVSAHVALEQAFQPAAVAAVLRTPDYFGWLVLTLDPDFTLQGQPYLYSQNGPWNRTLAERFDWEADPWAPNEDVYLRTAPAISQVRYGVGWALATTDPDSGWLPSYFFRPMDQDWIPARPDPALSGAERTLSTDRFSIIYWEWDESYLEEILRLLDAVHQAGEDHFGVVTGPEYIYRLVSADSSVSSSATEGEVLLSSPALSRPLDPAEFRAETILQSLVGVFSQLRVQPVPDSWILAYGILIWQYEQLLGEQLPDSPEGILGLEAWPPSQATIDQIQLSDLWHPAASAAPEQQLAELYSAELLVTYVVKTDGEEALPRMVRALEQANTMGGWIEIVTAQLPDDFETDWRLWMETEYGIPQGTD